MISSFGILENDFSQSFPTNNTFFFFLMNSTATKDKDTFWVLF